MTNFQQCREALRGSACLPIDKILSRLDKVKAKGAGKWVACCPAHQDKNPSLGIKECDDGKVLLHCWAGCTATDITAAIGLELRDLFPGDKPVRRGPSKAAIRHERAVYLVGLSLQAQGLTLSAEDQARFEIAKKRLEAN
ncbi:MULTISPECIES: virulence-associated protein E [unclassified Pseudomonas]|uniref:virulence-associated protein E n=1 Tax=unclassified Pseudomonas TaxID=196821 RepID=UPI00257F5B9A|nr:MULTISPECIES: virulence-associated protein E [unclassified Pseudomonas]